MIENRDIHSYNCDVYVTHEKEIYYVNILDGLEITMERKGSPGKCTFSIIQEEMDKVEFQEGDSVKIRISQRWVFYGFIFTKSRSSDGVIKFTCYDQIRYLKAKESVVFMNKSVGEIVTALANDRGLNLGTIRDSSYKIPTLTRENSTMYDIIMYAIEQTTAQTGENFVLYDRCGKLTLCPLKHMFRNVVIDCDVIQDFDYESSIDKDTYNIVRVGYKSAKDGKLTYVTARDQNNINQWGMLQLTETADNGWQATTKAHTLLNMYNSKTKTLKIKGAMGANEVVGGSIVLVNLDLGDMKLSRNMVVDTVVHKIEDGLYSMDLDLVGGEFVSTKGVQGEESSTSDSKTGGSSNERRMAVNYDWGHGITADMINKVLKGPLAGKGEQFIKLGNAYKINPLIAALIMRMECGPNFDSYNARVRHNFSGITKDPLYPNMGSFVKYPSDDIGIERSFRLLGHLYLHKWKYSSIDPIIYKYAPPDKNDSKKYVSNVKSWYKMYSGQTWNNSKLGTGVDENEGHTRYENLKRGYATIQYSSNSESNDVIEKAISYARSRVGMKYSQGNRNSFMYKGPENARHFDCSSLCYYAYAYAGYLPRVPSGKNAMTTAGLKSNPGAYKMKRISIKDAKRGDILWRPGHVGLYLGNNATVEANSEKEGINYRPNNKRLFKEAYRPIYL